MITELTFLLYVINDQQVNVPALIIQNSIFWKFWKAAEINKHSKNYVKTFFLAKLKYFTK